MVNFARHRCYLGSAVQRAAGSSHLANNPLTKAATPRKHQLIFSNAAASAAFDHMAHCHTLSEAAHEKRTKTPDNFLVTVGDNG
jgi:hypothetical protein